MGSAPRSIGPTATAAALLIAGAAAGARAQAPTERPWTDPSPHVVRHVPVAPGVRLEVLDWGGSGPALVFLTGMGHTAHVYDDFAARFRAGIAHATLIELPGARHYAFLSRPDAVERAMRDVLARTR